MRNKLVELAEKPYIKEGLPEIKVGDTITVGVLIKEGVGKDKDKKTRVQKYKGVVLAKSGVGTGKSITVRKVSSGVGIERVFLINSPVIESIIIDDTGAKFRRSKLYYRRDLKGKKARIKYDNK